MVDKGSMNRFSCLFGLFLPLLSQAEQFLFLLKFLGQMLIQPVHGKVRSQKDRVHDRFGIGRAVADDAVPVDSQEGRSSGFRVIHPFFKAAHGSPH